MSSLAHGSQAHSKCVEKLGNLGQEVLHAMGPLFVEREGLLNPGLASLDHCRLLKPAHQTQCEQEAATKALSDLPSLV